MRVYIDEKIDLTDEIINQMHRSYAEAEHFKHILGEIFRGRVIKKLGFDPGNAPAKLVLSRTEGPILWTQTFKMTGWIEVNDERAPELPRSV